MRREDEMAPPGRRRLGISEPDRAWIPHRPKPDLSPAAGIETALSCVSPSPSELVPCRATRRHTGGDCVKQMLRIGYPAVCICQKSLN